MPRATPLLLLSLLGCAEPFEINRKDLGPFRIAAIGVEDGFARAAIWSGQGMTHAQSPSLSWSLDGAPLGEGYDVAVPEEGTLGLVVVSPEGETYEAQVTALEAPAPPSAQRYSLGVVEDVTLDARRALEASPVEHGVPEGEAARLVLEGAPTDATARWMSAEGRGTLLEVETDAADLLPEELTFDDGVVVDRVDSGTGVYHQLALLFDGEGANTWRWIDVAVGADGPFMRQGERLVAVDAAVEPGAYAMTAQVDPEAPGGLSFSDLQPADGLGDMDLACAKAEAPFDLDQVAEGRCAEDELDGARVVMELQ